VRVADQYRFDIQGAMGADTSDIQVLCSRCSWSATLSTPITLGDLIDRADEHAEVCR
jgi:hypothetical protein